MRIALIGNLAGVSNEYLVGLRSLGVEADLFVTEAEGAATLVDLTSADCAQLRPEWLKLMPSFALARARRGPAKWLLAASTLVREIPVARALLRYDLLHSHTGSLLTNRLCRLLFLVLRLRPYIAAATGSDLREVAWRERTLRGWWMRAFFRRARRVLLLNIDMVEFVHELGLRDAAFFPFAVDTDTFRPRRVVRKYGSHGAMMFFMMSRLDWARHEPSGRRTSANENDRVFLAFARFARDHPDALLVVLDRGADKDEARRLAASLGISERVLFVPPMSQAERIEHLLMADVCLDQFGLGAYGLGTVETMACGKPLITYVRADLIERCGMEYPPILNARSADEIWSAMVAATDPALRDNLGRQAREWVERYHARGNVCAKLFDIYRRLLDA